MRPPSRGGMPSAAWGPAKAATGTRAGISTLPCEARGYGLESLAGRPTGETHTIQGSGDGCLRFGLTAH